MSEERTRVKTNEDAETADDNGVEADDAGFAAPDGGEAEAQATEEAGGETATGEVAGDAGGGGEEAPGETQEEVAKEEKSDEKKSEEKAKGKRGRPKKEKEEKPKESQKKKPGRPAKEKDGKDDKKAGAKDDKKGGKDDKKGAPAKGKDGKDAKGAPAVKGKEDPKKGKEKIVEEKEIEEDEDPDADHKGMLLNYMKSTNRPYSLLNVFDNLRGKIKKKTLETLLDELEKEKQITGKLYGKAKIYWYNQELQPQLDQEEMNKLKEENEELRKSKAENDANLKEIKATIAKFEKTPTLAELEFKIEEVKKQTEATLQKILRLKSADVVLASDEDIRKAETARDRVEAIMKKRQRVLRDIVDAVCEGTEMKPFKVADMMGIDATLV